MGIVLAGIGMELLAGLKKGVALLAYPTTGVFTMWLRF